jgi:hypothetical protein
VWAHQRRIAAFDITGDERDVLHTGGGGIHDEAEVAVTRGEDGLGDGAYCWLWD